MEMRNTRQPSPSQSETSMEQVNKKLSRRKGFTFSELPTEMVSDVLMKLPTETLCVCSAVCKSWYQTIKTPCFIKTYNTNIIQSRSCPIVIPGDEFFQEQEKSKTQLLDPDEDTRLTFFDNSLEFPKCISAVYPCNDWVLFISKSKPSNVQREKPYFICNPSTGEHIRIPQPPVYAPSAVIGLGWDAVSGTFKVIRISDACSFRNYHGTNLEVYNVGTGKWGTTKWTDFDKEPCRAASMFRFGHRPNTFLNGRLHWISYPYHKPMNIISFRLDTEKFQQVPMPPGLDMDPAESRPRFMFRGFGMPSDRRIFRHHLLVLGGRLCLVHNVDDNHVEIWMMNVYELESSWEKKCVIRNIATSSGDIVKGPYRPINLRKNGEILMSCYDNSQGHYHPATKVFTPLHSPPISPPPLHVGSFIYVEKR